MDAGKDNGGVEDMPITDYMVNTVLDSIPVTNTYSLISGKIIWSHNVISAKADAEDGENIRSHENSLELPAMV